MITTITAMTIRITTIMITTTIIITRSIRMLITLTVLKARANRRRNPDYASL